MGAAGHGECRVAENNEWRLNWMGADIALLEFCQMRLWLVGKADQINFLPAVGYYKLPAIIADRDSRFVVERRLWFKTWLEWRCKARAIGRIQVEDLAKLKRNNEALADRRHGRRSWPL